MSPYKILNLPPAIPAQGVIAVELFTWGCHSGPEFSSNLPLSLPVGRVATFRVCGLWLWWLLPGLARRSWVGPTSMHRGFPLLKTCPEMTELQGCADLMSYET